MWQGLNITKLNKCGSIFAGTKLLNHVLDLSAKQNISEIYLHVQTNNEDPIAFYKKFGFEVTETIHRNHRNSSPPYCYVLSKVIVQANSKKWVSSWHLCVKLVLGRLQRSMLDTVGTKNCCQLQALSLLLRIIFLLLFYRREDEENELNAQKDCHLHKKVILDVEKCQRF